MPQRKWILLFAFFISLALMAWEGYDYAAHQQGPMQAESINEADALIHRLYEQRAADGDVFAMRLVAEDYLKGKRVKQDIPKGELLWEKAAYLEAEKGIPFALYTLGRDYIEGNYVERNGAKGIALWKKTANEGDIQSQIALAEAYYNNHFVSDLVEKDDEESVRWYLRVLSNPSSHAFPNAVQAAKAALYQIGRDYVDGTARHAGNKKPVLAFDGIRGLDVWKKAASLGDVRSQCALGQAYLMGRVVPKNDAEAAQWYRRAVENPALNEEPPAFQSVARGALGELLIRGENIPHDIPQGMALLEQAAAQESPYYQLVLAGYYGFGPEGARDDRKALTLYQKLASQQGDEHRFARVEAQYHLGKAYDEGRGVEKDKAQAILWYTKSAEDGGHKAAVFLAHAYATGDGLPHDDRKAYAWALKALEETQAFDPQFSEFVFALEKKLTSQEPFAKRGDGGERKGF